METKEQAILQSAEAMIRQGGYNNFSFRDIAKEVGIKSSSVHYYFPTKEDLGQAVAQYYTERFMDLLESPEVLLERTINPIEHYINAFRHALMHDKRMCLCGLLGAEVDGLPTGVVAATQTFFSRNLQWLEQAYALIGDDKKSKQNAIHTLCLLEGVMMTSNVMDDIDLFDQAVALIKR